MGFGGLWVFSILVRITVNREYHLRMVFENPKPPYFRDWDTGTQSFSKKKVFETAGTNIKIGFNVPLRRVGQFTLPKFRPSLG
jgi:hypothetical protein